MLYVHKLIVHDEPLEYPVRNVYDLHQKNCHDQIAKQLILHEDSLSHQIQTGHMLHFPELRLIEYDCGWFFIINQRVIVDIL